MLRKIQKCLFGLIEFFVLGYRDCAILVTQFPIERIRSPNYLIVKIKSLLRHYVIQFLTPRAYVAHLEPIAIVTGT